MIDQMNDRPSMLDANSSNWQTTLWREWCRAQDEDYAFYLYDLVKSTALGWKFVAAIAAIGAVGGALLGYLLGLIFTTNMDLTFGPWPIGTVEFGSLDLSGFLLAILIWGLGVGGSFFGIAASRKYRSWYFWWQGLPSASRVEQALEEAIARRPDVKEIWADPLHRLQRFKALQPTPEQLIPMLSSENWADRFAARKTLVSLGGEATAALKEIIDDRSHPLWQTAIWLLTSIEHQTANRFAWRVGDTLCPRCLTRFAARPVDLPWGIDFTYYGCRDCGQSRDYLYLPQGVVAALNSSWTQEQDQQEGRLRVNWLMRRELFDFDGVEIMQASDEDVERFAVQVGNDTDPYRRQRYPQMTCVISPSCHLSENTLRILRRMFGQVKQMSALPERKRSVTSSKLIRLSNAVDETDDAAIVDEEAENAIKVD